MRADDLTGVSGLCGEKDMRKAGNGDRWNWLLEEGGKCRTTLTRSGILDSVDSNMTNRQLSSNAPK